MAKVGLNDTEVIKMVGTNDFASYKSVQKYIYRTAQDLKKKKIGPTGRRLLLN
jgi:hypothetical protein